jgi:hypothetical protein
MKGKEYCLCFVGRNTFGYKNLNKPLITHMQTHEHRFPRLAFSSAAIKDERRCRSLFPFHPIQPKSST